MYGTNSTSKNFEDLMTIASQNAAVAEKKVSGLGYDARKRRVDPKQVKLKEGVAKFLAKKDEEDKLKKDLEREKKEKLIQLRQQDRKATNRVRKMLSMTKSANKSCVDDAKDCLNASVAAQTQAGDFQPDEDDYGYTSNYADEMHKKMMEKYKSIPVKPAFPQERGVYIQKPQPLPRARRKNYETSDPSQYDAYQEGSSPEQANYEEPSSSKKQSKPKKPPPPDYQSLLALAQERQKEPAAPIKIVPEKMEKEEFEFGRPMTAKEKAAYLAEKDLKERAARKHDLKSDRNNNSSATSNDSKGERDKTPSFKIPRSRPREEEPAVAPKRPKVAEPEPYRPTKESQPQRKKAVEPTRNIESVPNSKLHSMLTKQNQPKQQQPIAHSSSSNGSSSFGPVSKSVERPVMPPPSLPASTNPYKSKESQKVRPPPQKVEQINKERKIPDKLELVREKPRYLSAFEGKEREKERAREESRKQQPVPKEVFKSKLGSNRDQSLHDSRDRNKPGASARMPQRSDFAQERKPAKRFEEPPQRQDIGRSPPQRRDVGRSPPQRRDIGRSPPQRRDVGRPPPPRMRGEPPRMKPKPVRGRAVIDSDEDYDSEMDDFIDDSEADLGNISAEISRIFNYDRRRYMYDESDEECMETSVAEQLREESRSLKIGIQEDKEDMAREEEEKRRKLLKMKKSGRL